VTHPSMSTHASAKAITFEEVEKHDKKDDCWMVIHGKVYDVTKFLGEHPGGEEVMLESKGN
jgi:cytochrome b involved in lipid metabolism